MRALMLGILSSFFFAFTFVLNRSMELEGGSWLWSTSLRYFFMVPLLLLLVLWRGNLQPLWREMRRQPGTWLLWSFVGFGLFYAPLTFAAAYGPAWLVAGSWQITIVAGSLLVPLFYDLSGQRQKIPVRGLLMSLLILLGVFLMQMQSATALTMREALLGFLPVVVAAFAYPLGNRKMMAALEGRLDSYQRALGMTLASLTLWIVLALFGATTAGAPSEGQVLQSLLVAVSSGVIATVLFFSATDLARGNVRQLAAVEATQAGEVIFAVIGEMLILAGHLPSALSWAGMALVMIGMVLHSYVSHSPAPSPTAKKESASS